MKIKKVDLGQERKIIIRLITSTAYCKRVLPLIQSNLFKSLHSKIITSWVQEYFEKYNEAPKGTIQDIFYNKKSVLSDEESEELKEFLSSVSNEFETSDEKENVEYEVEEAKVYLRIQSIDYLSNELQSAVEENNPSAGEQAITEFSKIEENLSDDVSILKDMKEVISAFDHEEEVLFKFPGALGEVAGEFSRGDFVAFFAPMKRGKTFWLWQTAERAMKEGLKVLFFTLEMTKRQMIRRAWHSLSGLPREEGVVKIPVFKEDDSGKYRIIYKEEERKAFDVKEIQKLQKRLKFIFRSGEIRIVQLPGYQATIKDIEVISDNLSFYEGFNADVIVIDYADLMAPSRNVGSEYRHKIDDIWKGVRALAQRKNILAVTASQTSKETFSRDVRQADAAEDIRKIAHVTSALGLNQKEEERDKGYMRVKQLALREGKQISDQAIITQCLDVGKIYLDSRFLKDCRL